MLHSYRILQHSFFLRYGLWTIGCLLVSSSFSRTTHQLKFSHFSYELQIEEGYQRKGIGEHLMKCLERLAKVWDMERVVLTLLTNNPGARKFYERHGYMRDDTSPDDEKDYEIMSKEF